MGQPLLQFGQVVGKVLIDESLVREVHDEGLILAIRRSHQVHGRLVHRSPLLSHRAGVIDEQTHRNRGVGVFKKRDGLRDIVFQNTEIVLRQVVHQFAVVVQHGNVQVHFLHVLSNGVVAGSSAQLAVLRRRGGRVAH
jgi:hypothetical protein